MSDKFVHVAKRSIRKLLDGELLVEFCRKVVEGNDLRETLGIVRMSIGFSQQCSNIKLRQQRGGLVGATSNATGWR